jgi:hypothetical protein
LRPHNQAVEKLNFSRKNSSPPKIGLFCMGKY